MPVGNRILAVDDNAANLAIVDEIFQGKLKVRLAQDGNEAFRVAPTFMPDVVLLDVMMPKPDGFEVCSWMKNNRTLRNSQIIMVSAKTDIDSRLRAYAAGADDYVTKPFDERELCAKVYASLRNKSLNGDVHQRIESLCNATGSTLELISHLRDAETGEHLDRMRIYSHLLAAELRLSSLDRQIDDDFLDDLGRASPLHDIGKIAIPDAILRKPGPLTEAEREHMKQHTIVGEQILNCLARQHADSRFFGMAAEIARWHHESYDGSGYPDRLSGNTIPLSARIVKVADVFDALTSERVYKPRCEPAVALDQIARLDASQFDPIIIEAFVRIFDDLAEVCDISHSTEFAGK